MRQVRKHIFWNFIDRRAEGLSVGENLENQTNKIKSKKNKEAMMSDKISTIEEAVSGMEGIETVKTIKKDKGLIERAESSKIILTEDNRQVLVD